MTTVLIAGCGYVGSALAERLLAAGRRVYGLKRTPGGLPDGVEPLLCDLGQGASIEHALPPAVDEVVVTISASGSGEEAYRAAYERALGNLLAALKRRGIVPRRLLFTSSTSVYAQSGGEWIDESSPSEPTHYTGAVMRSAEELIWSAASELTHAVVLRLGGIYGPGRTRLIETVRRGTARLTPAPLYSNRIHRDDAAAALAHLLELERPERLYLGTDADPAALNDVMRFIAAEIGAPEPPVGEAGPSGLDDRRYRTNKRCNSARLRASGFRFEFPSYREGYRALIRAEE